MRKTRVVGAGMPVGAEVAVALSAGASVGVSALAVRVGSGPGVSAFRLGVGSGPGVSVVGTVAQAVTIKASTTNITRKRDRVIYESFRAEAVNAVAEHACPHGRIDRCASAGTSPPGENERQELRQDYSREWARCQSNARSRG